MRRAYEIEKKNDYYIVHVNDNGHCVMCEFNGEKWIDCHFKTYEEAQKAMTRYNEMWSE